MRQALLVIALLVEMVFQAAGVQADSRPISAALHGPILFTQLPAGEAVERRPSTTGGMLRMPYGDGARIVLLSSDRHIRLLTAAFSSACDADVSFDGKRFLFAGKKTAADSWNVYEMAVDGTGLRQITRGPGDCRSPGYQSTQYRLTADEPWYQFTFVGSGPKTLNEYGTAPAASLYSCRTDGSEVRRLTHNLSSDFDPAIMGDGRLLYASWQRARLEHGALGRVGLFGVCTDGADGTAFFLEGGKRIKHMPCTTTAGLAVFVESDRVPWDGAGTLGCVQLRRPLHSYRPLSVASDGLFHTPSPLPDGTLLVSRRPVDGSGTHGIYRLDPATRRLELIFQDPRYHAIQAKAVCARPEPDGRASVVDETDATGKLYCLDLYTTDWADPAWLPRGSVKRLRVLEGMPRQGPGGAGRPAVELAPRRILGEIDLDRNVQRPMDEWRALTGQAEDIGKPLPAEKLGSFSLDVPAGTPLELQIVDGQGMALRSCGWIWAKNHEPRGCVGCHEDGELTPENALPLAVTEDSIRLAPPPESRTSIEFGRDILPIVAKKCVPCHAHGQSPPRLDAAAAGASAGPAAESPRGVYDALMAGEAAGGEQNPYGKYVHRGRARTSPLVWHVYGRNTSRPWDGDAGRHLAKPIPLGSAVPLTEEEQRLIVRWIDMGAVY
ncbi:MAG: hypothetical protein ACLQNE_40095 [Thermoguttaceae bacterium]